VASGSLLLPEFTAFFRYTDLYPCRADLNRTLELYTPIYTLKQQIITGKIPDYYIQEQFQRIAQIKESNKTEEEKEQDKENKKRQLKQKLRSIDRLVRNKTFYVTIDLGDIFFSLTEKALGNHKLLDVGISGQKIIIVKKEKTMKINAFGIVIDTYFSLDKVYSYCLMFFDSGRVYGENLALQLSSD
jgi:hypothetical protein